MRRAYAARVTEVIVLPPPAIDVAVQVAAERALPVVRGLGKAAQLKGVASPYLGERIGKLWSFLACTPYCPGGLSKIEACEKSGKV